MGAANLRITRSMSRDLNQSLDKPACRMRAKSLCDEKIRRRLTRNLNNKDDVSSSNKMTGMYANFSNNQFPANIITGGQLNLSNYPTTSSLEFKNSDVSRHKLRDDTLAKSKKHGGHHSKYSPVEKVPWDYNVRNVLPFTSRSQVSTPKKDENKKGPREIQSTESTPIIPLKEQIDKQINFVNLSSENQNNEGNVIITSNISIGRDSTHTRLVLIVFGFNAESIEVLIF